MTMTGLKYRSVLLKMHFCADPSAEHQWNDTLDRVTDMVHASMRPLGAKTVTRDGFSFFTELVEPLEIASSGFVDCVHHVFAKWDPTIGIGIARVSASLHLVNNNALMDCIMDYYVWENNRKFGPLFPHSWAEFLFDPVMGWSNLGRFADHLQVCGPRLSFEQRFHWNEVCWLPLDNGAPHLPRSDGHRFSIISKPSQVADLAEASSQDAVGGYADQPIQADYSALSEALDVEAPHQSSPLGTGAGVDETRRLQ